MEELLSGQSRPAQICRRYEISSSLLCHWKRQYARGKFNNEPIEEAALRDRVERLERLVGKLTLENEFLERGLQNSLAQAERSRRSSHAGDGSWTASGGGAGVAPAQGALN